MKPVLLKYLIVVFWLGVFIPGLAFYGSHEPFFIQEPEIREDKDTGKAEALPYKFKDESWDPTNPGNQGGLFMENPANIKDSVFYDPKENRFEFYQKMGNIQYRRPSYMDFEEYMQYDMQKQLKDYWKQRHEAENVQNKSKSLIPPIFVSGEAFDRIFGGNTVDIRPSGRAELTFGVNTSRTDNPAIAENQRKVSVFDFDQTIQLNVIGKIGDKLKTTINYDTQAAFDFNNQVKLEYSGYEDDIIKKIEAGNVSLPLQGSLISGSQALFGFKTQMQFGKTTVTTLLSQQRGKRQEVDVQGGVQTTRFEITGDNYDVNKHFFLGHYFRDNYNKALSNLPVIISPITITKVEVYITNMSGAVDNTRNVLALADLGESDRRSLFANPSANQIWRNQGFVGPPTAENSGPFPSSTGSNNLYTNLTSATQVNAIRDINQVNNRLSQFARKPFDFQLVQDYEVLERARKLAPTEFTFHPQLGYLSLNSPLNNNEVLAVAYQYTANGKTYQVGEFSTDGQADPKLLLLKMLKASAPRVRNPIWDLMMKNVYAIGGFSLSEKDFRLEIVYNDQKRGINLNYLTESAAKEKILLQLCGLDSINNQQERIPDGNFDWIAGVTINPQNGRIFFPLVEPFGSDLRNKMSGIIQPNGEPLPENQAFIKKYVYQELYDSTKTAAQQIPAKNRFRIRGSFSSSSTSEISLNATNVPQGSVRVTANGTSLTENVDYTVDYTGGKVKIINASLMNSNANIKVSFENQQAFTPIVKSLIGTTIEHKVNKDLVIGGTFLRLTERPLTPKVTLGDEPVANMIYGVNLTYRTDAPWLTKAVNLIPFISTKESSSLTYSGEFAHLLPGHSKAVTKEGISYIDDFEATQSVIDLRQQFNWQLASLPKGQPDLFPETKYSGSLKYGFNRAKLSWYTVDPLFAQNLSTTPDHIRNSPLLQSNHNTREVLEREVFPNRQLAQASLPNIPMLDLAFYPNQRGQYNFENTANGTDISRGINNDGTLKEAGTRWGGLMRRIENNDFETANIEFIQLWMMDPFNEDNPNQNNQGELYFNMGDVSEDVIPDNRKMFENGLSTDGNIDSSKIAFTQWGLVPKTPAVVNAFDASPAARPFQDVGYDGLSNQGERSAFASYLSGLQGILTPEAFNRVNADPSSDDFEYFRSSEHDAQQHNILRRYKNFSGLENNSNVEQPDGYPITATNLPNNEDINRDNNLNYNEAYFQYKIKIARDAMVVGQNNITNVFETTITTKDGRTRNIKWYQFKIPLLNPDKKVGEISDFRSIRFMRMFMKGFSDSIVLRMARLELIRGDWRRYLLDLTAPGEYIADDRSNNALFDVAAVNVEENGSRIPVKYVLPPGIERVIDPTQANLRQLNEQALVLRVCDLPDGKSKAAYRNVDLDMRMYKKIKMFVHAEATKQDVYKKGELRFFMRMGTDFDQNYYEYEIPLTFTPWNTAEPDAIWPADNNLEIEIAKLLEAKLKRNNAEFDITKRYVWKDENFPNNTIYVVGNPNLAACKTIMVGVRNPKRAGLQDIGDDGLTKCAEVWVNELRLSDFDQRGGWAANSRIQAKLADFADATVSGNIKTQGFGGIEQKLNERSRDNTFMYDFSTTVRLQKFFPEKLKLQLPMFYSVSEAFINPMFDPLNPDVPYRTSLNSIDDPERRANQRRATQDYTKRRSINFTNIKKDKGAGSKKSHFWDIENITLSYSFNEIFRRSINVEHSITRNHRASLAYTFSPTPLQLKPFAKIKALKSDYFKLLTDLAIGLSPSRMSFRTEGERNFSETLARDIENPRSLISPFIDKRFNMTRTFDFRYEITKSLSVDYAANVSARIDEPPGRIDTTQLDPLNRPGYTRRDSVIANIRRGGRMTLFHHTANANWNIPINKFPLLNWITSQAKYSANFDWISAPPNILAQQASGDTAAIANTITNSNTKTINANVTFTTLYNKVKFLKEINNPKPKKEKPPKTKEQIKKDKEAYKKMTPKEKLAYKAREDSIKKAEQGPNPYLVGSLKFLMMFKSASANLNEQRGTSLPGFLPTPKIFGMADGNFNNASAPGLPFVFGDQSNLVLENANKYGWITKSSQLNTFFTRSYNQNFTGNVVIEPIKDMKITLNWSRNATKNNTAVYKYDQASDSYTTFSPNETGSYSISVITWGTAFVKDDRGSNSSANFQQFLSNREEISKKLGASRGLSKDSLNTNTGFFNGYGNTQQDVLLPAFFAAYTKTPIGNVPLNFFAQLPKPNWRFNYDGLSKLPLLKPYIKTLTMSHSYRSTFNIASYTTNQFYVDDGKGNSTLRDLNRNYLPRREIQVVTITESLAPFVGFDATLQNSMLVKIELKRDRTISLSMANSQVTELSTNEIQTSLGYNFKDVIPPFAKRLNLTLKSDLRLRCDVSFRRNKTVIRQVETAINEITAGQNQLTIRLNADYIINSRLNLRMFHERNVTTPRVTTSFPTSNVRTGIQLQFTIAQ